MEMSGVYVMCFMCELCRQLFITKRKCECNSWIWSRGDFICEKWELLKHNANEATKASSYDTQMWTCYHTHSDTHAWQKSKGKWGYTVELNQRLRFLKANHDEVKVWSQNKAFCRCNNIIQNVILFQVCTVQSHPMRSFEWCFPTLALSSFSLIHVMTLDKV